MLFKPGSHISFNLPFRDFLPEGRRKEGVRMVINNRTRVTPIQREEVYRVYHGEGGGD